MKSGKGKGKIIKNRTYTVVLRYPDYLDSSGDDMYIVEVRASSVSFAVHKARRKAVKAQCTPVVDCTDFQMLLVLEGSVNILATPLTAI